MMSSFTRRALGGLVVACSMMAGSVVAQTQTNPATTVLAIHPMVVSLGEVLTDGTTIDIVQAAPANLPYSRVNAYFSGRGANNLARDAGSADAVLTLRSIWPEDPLYPLARRSNIRLVEIDVARPVDGALPGIALQSASQQGESSSPIATQPWLNPSNLGRMADILVTDLQRLVPQEREKLGANLAAFKQQLVALSAQSESELADISNLSVVVVSDRLNYLVSALNLDAVPFVKEGSTWDSKAVQGLIEVVGDNDASVLLHERLPEQALSALHQAIPTAKVIVVETPKNSAEVGAAITSVVNALKKS